MEPESSSPYSQVPAICPYPEPTPSSLHPLPLPEDPSQYYPPSDDKYPKLEIHISELILDSYKSTAVVCTIMHCLI